MQQAGHDMQPLTGQEVVDAVADVCLELTRQGWDDQRVQPYDS